MCRLDVDICWLFLMLPSPAASSNRNTASRIYAFCIGNSGIKTKQFQLDSRCKKFQAVRVIESNSCAAVIPCFNESASIANLVMAVRQRLPCVLVVDDGSTDETASLAQNTGAVVVKHELNLGKGASLKTGLSHALKLGHDGPDARRRWAAFAGRFACVIVLCGKNRRVAGGRQPNE